MYVYSQKSTTAYDAGRRYPRRAPFS